LCVGGRGQFERITDLHEFADFLVRVIIADTNNRVHRLVFRLLFFRFFLANQFHERQDATLVAFMHAVDFVHDDGDFARFPEHHIEDIISRHVIISNIINERFVAHIACVVIDRVVSDGFEDFGDKKSFPATGRTIDIDSFFIIHIAAFFVKLGQ